MPKSLVVAFAMFFAAVPAAQAQAPDTAVLAGVVISASKTPTRRSDLTQAVTVIAGAELRARGISTVGEALRTVVGASIVANGSHGAVTTLFVRGGESRYTRVLVDGVPINAVGGFVDLSHLTTANVEKIEIVRGSAGVVHGADAVSGVVQVFTRRGGGPASFSSDVRAGTHNTLEADGAFGGSMKGMSYSAAAGRQSTDGMLPFNNQYRNGTMSGLLGFRTGPSTSATLSGRYTDAEFHYPTDYLGNATDSNAFRDQKRLTLSLDASTRFASGISLRFLGGSNDVDDFTDDILEAATPRARDRFTSRGIRRRAEVQLSKAIAASAVTFGAEYQRESERSGSASAPVGQPLASYSSFSGRRTTRAAYGELLGTVSRLSYNLGARIDDQSDFGRATTHRAGASIPLGNARFRAAWGTAFNAPAFTQLLPTAFTVGSPNLNPEKSRSVEAGVEHAVLRGVVSATYFDQRFRDLIHYVPGGPPDFKGSFDNLAEARSNGYELEFGAPLPRGWWLNGGVTALETRVTSLAPGYAGDAKVGDALVRRPRRTGSVVLARSGSGSGRSFSATARYVGKRPDLDFSAFPSVTVMLPAVTLLDLSGSLPILRRGGAPLLSVTVRVNNAFDKNYQEVLNFDAPGRIILIGARVETLHR